MNIMHPGLLSPGYEYDTLFNQFIDNFATEKDRYDTAGVDIDNFFKSYTL